MLRMECREGRNQRAMRNSSCGERHPFHLGLKQQSRFLDSALFRYSLATKIKARCAGMSLMWLHVGYLVCDDEKAALSTAIALQTDFPFQTVYKERFNPLVRTKCTNIADAMTAELGRTAFRCCATLFLFQKTNFWGLVFWRWQV